MITEVEANSFVSTRAKVIAKQKPAVTMTAIHSGVVAIAPATLAMAPPRITVSIVVRRLRYGPPLSTRMTSNPPSAAAPMGLPRYRQTIIAAATAIPARRPRVQWRRRSVAARLADEGMVKV